MECLSERSAPLDTCFFRWLYVSNWSEWHKCDKSEVQTHIEATAAFYGQEFRKQAKWEIVSVIGVQEKMLNISIVRLEG